MSPVKKATIAVAGAVALVLAVLLAIPFIFQDRIAARAQAAISRSIDADVSWGGIGLSLLRDFPNATLRLDDLTVTGRDRFVGDTLTHVSRFDLVVSLPSIIRNLRGSGPLVVRTIGIDGPAVQLRVLEDGLANWDLFSAVGEASQPASTGNAIALNLRELRVRDGRVRIDNAESDLTLVADGVEQTLEGDFTRSRFRVRSRTTANAVSLRFGGVPYLHETALDVDSDVDVDLDAARVTIEKGDVRLNDLLLALSGAVGFGDALALDLAFESPGSEFGEVLSLLPMLHAQPEFRDLRTAGTMAVSGWVRGEYGEAAFPAFAARLDVRDGMLRYPDLPLPARDVFVDLAVSNPGGSPDATEVRVERFAVVIGDDLVTGRFVMRTPVSDPDVEVQVNGRLDLAALNRTFKLQGAEELRGLLVADVEARGRRSDLDAGRYDAIIAAGTVEASDIVLRLADLPHAVAVERGVLHVTPRHAELETLRGVIGASDVALTGRLDNLFGYALRDEELRGSARLTSSRFVLDEWRSDDEARAILVPARLDFALDAEIDTLVFADIALRDARGSLHIADQRATLEGFDLSMFGGSLAVEGFYESASPERPTFDVELELDSIDVVQAALGMELFRALAPAAAYARGRVSTELRLSGAVGDDMAPIRDALAGEGLFRTSGMSLQGFPALDYLAERLATEQLRNPALIDLQSTFRIRDGRLHVNPFTTRLGQFSAEVAGSHGLDESLDYTVALELPRAALGAEAGRAVAALAAQAGRAGVDWQAADAVTVGVRLGGTVRQPTVGIGLQEAVTMTWRDAGGAVRDAVVERADSALDEARLRSAAEAARIIEEAERQAARIRAEADSAAVRVRQEGYDRADALVERATSPAARLAARAAADRLRQEADSAAARIRAEADGRAAALVEDARRRAGGGPGDAAGGRS